MYAYETVSEAVNGLIKRGYTHNFKYCDEGIECTFQKIKLTPEKFKIKEVYRFEGNTDPADEAVVYAIESNDGIKGVLVNGYGISTNSNIDEMIKKL
jgi:hypothetical protein